jgi:hypothetical protein
VADIIAERLVRLSERGLHQVLNAWAMGATIEGGR